MERVSLNTLEVYLGLYNNSTLSEDELKTLEKIHTDYIQLIKTQKGPRLQDNFSYSFVKGDLIISVNLGQIAELDYKAGNSISLNRIDRVFSSEADRKNAKNINGYYSNVNHPSIFLKTLPTAAQCEKYDSMRRNLQFSSYSNNRYGSPTIVIYNDFDELVSKELRKFPTARDTITTVILTHKESYYGADEYVSVEALKEIYPDFGFSGSDLTTLLNNPSNITGLIQDAIKYIKVYQTRNEQGEDVRIVLGIFPYHTRTYGYRNNGYVLRMYLVHKDDPVYDYMDKDTFGMMFDLRHPGVIQFGQDVKGLVKYPNEIEAYHRRMSRGSTTRNPITVINNKELKSIVNAATILAATAQKKEALLKAKKEKISEKVKALANPGDTLKINDITFTINSAEYLGQKLEASSVDFRPFIRQHTRLGSMEFINFDNVQSFFVETLQMQRDLDENIRFGDLTLNFKAISKETSNFATQRYYYIENFKINKDEVAPILNRALCFTDMDTYKKFLSQVSKCSLKIHRYLQNGIKSTIYDSLSSNRRDQIKLKLEIVRKTNRNYLKLGKKLFKIKNINRLITLENRSYLNEVINLLSNPEVIEGVTPTDLKEIIVEGKKTYQEALDKSKKLLDDTVAKFNLQAGTQNGRTGYFVQGKLRKYFIENDVDLVDGTGRCPVYDENGQYICIIDKSNNQVGLDKLVNRIYALKNDRLLTSQIHTL